MKLISIFLILSIITLTISKLDLDNYSINLFIIDLKRKGLFEIIKSIKKDFGQDVAIISCEELNKNHSGNCKKAVTDYMPKNDKNIEDIDSKVLINVKRILSMKNFSPKEFQYKYERIMERVEKLIISKKKKLSKLIKKINNLFFKKNYDKKY